MSGISWMSCHRIWLAANVIVTPSRYRSAEASDGGGAVMTPTGQSDSKPVPSQEDRLLDLLRKAEVNAYALAHGYDIGGHPDRAFVALGERIRDTATDVSDLARPIEPHSAAPLYGLRSRAFSLRRLLRGPPGRVSAWRLPRLTGDASSEAYYRVDELLHSKHPALPC